MFQLSCFFPVFLFCFGVILACHPPDWDVEHGIRRSHQWILLNICFPWSCAEFVSLKMKKKMANARSCMLQYYLYSRQDIPFQKVTRALFSVLSLSGLKLIGPSEECSDLKRSQSFSLRVSWEYSAHPFGSRGDSMFNSAKNHWANSCVLSKVDRELWVPDCFCVILTYCSATLWPIFFIYKMG